MTGRFPPRLLIDALPRSRFISRVCKRYVDHYNSDNVCDMRRNGELRWIEEVIPGYATVFDVGANVGDWTDLVLSIKPDLKVHCFEPCTVTFKLLQTRNFGRGAVLNQAALGDHAGEAEICIFDEGAGTNSLYRRRGFHVEQRQTETIRLDTLDGYCDRAGVERIDLLKMDVEGHELVVLKGAARMHTEKRVERIQFEYGGTFIDAAILLKDMFESLNSYGFQLYKVYPREIRYAHSYDQSLENFQYSNWVALPSGHGGPKGGR